MKYDSTKFRELVLHICLRSEGDPSFGMTKLYKLLAFSEFAAYRKFGKPITGMPYRKLDNGPAPRFGLQEIQVLVDEKALFRRTDDYFGHRQDKCIALREANLKAFTAEEIAIVDAHIHDFWDKSAKQISELSHDLVGWRTADEKQDIPWEMALLYDEKLEGLDDSERERIEKYLDDVLANRAS